VLAARTSEESAAPVSNSQAIPPRPASSAGEIVPSSPISPAPHSPTIRRNGRDMSAYSLFLLGHDTFNIAKRLGITEARAHKRITLERDRLNDTRTEFEGQLP